MGLLRTETPSDRQAAQTCEQERDALAGVPGYPWLFRDGPVAIRLSKDKEEEEEGEGRATRVASQSQRYPLVTPVYKSYVVRIRVHPAATTDLNEGSDHEDAFRCAQTGSELLTFEALEEEERVDSRQRPHVLRAQSTLLRRLRQV